MRKAVVTVVAAGMVAAASGPVWAATLDDYAGKYPSDEVGGMTFLEQPAVVAGVAQAVADRAVRDWVLSPDTVQTPIAVNGGVLLSYACEPHNCGDHNWTIVIDLGSGDTDVCYHDASTMGMDESRWYDASGGEKMRPGACPSE